MNRSNIGLVAFVAAACAAPSPPARAPSAPPAPPDIQQQPAQSASGAATRLGTIAPLALGKRACVVHRSALVCSAPWVTIPEPIEGLAIGDERGCAVTSAGSLYCWGRNREGELGLGFRSEREPPTRVPGLAKVVDVALEYTSRSCVIDAEGKLFCWGMHFEVPTRVPTPAPATDVAYCNESLCATLDGGSLVVVEAHNPGTGPVLTAIPIAGSQGFSSPAFSWKSVPDDARFACGIQAGRVACAGDGTTSYRDDLLALGSATSFSANKYDACVVTPEGRIRCLGSGAPIEVQGVEGAVEVVVGAVGDWACARLLDGNVRCFAPVAGPQELHDPVAAAAQHP